MKTWNLDRGTWIKHRACFLLSIELSKQI